MKAGSINFAENYKSFSNTELLAILECPEDYQPIAVVAAKQELALRNLSEDAILQAKEFLIDKQLQEARQKEKIHFIKQKADHASRTLLNNFNPVQKGITSTEKVIRGIVVTFSLIYFYQVVTGYSFLIASIKDLSGFPLLSLLTLFPFLIIPVALITFWKRKPIGWVLLAIFLTFAVLEVLWTLFHALQWQYEENGFNRFFPTPSPMVYVVHLMVVGGTLYAICKQSLREVYSIKLENMQAILLLTGLATLLLVMLAS